MHYFSSHFSIHFLCISVLQWRRKGCLEGVKSPRQHVYFIYFWGEMGNNFFSFFAEWEQLLCRNRKRHQIQGPPRLVKFLATPLMSCLHYWMLASK